MSHLRLCLVAVFCLSPLALAGAHAQSSAAQVADAENKRKGKTAEESVIEAGDTKEDEQMRVQIKTAVWESQLGQLFADYLNRNDSPVETNRKAHALVERMFADITLTLFRSQAVQLMTQDLYEQNRVDMVINGRIQLFQMVLGERRIQVQNQALIRLLKRAPAFIFFAAFMASPIAREQSALAVKWASLKAAEKVGINVKTTLAETQGKLHLRDVASRKFFEVQNRKGEISLLAYADDTVNSFMKWFGVYSVYYYMAQSGSTDNVPVVGRVALIGLEQNIRLHQL